MRPGLLLPAALLLAALAHPLGSACRASQAFPLLPGVVNFVLRANSEIKGPARSTASCPAEEGSAPGSAVSAAFCSDPVFAVCGGQADSGRLQALLRINDKLEKAAELALSNDARYRELAEPNPLKKLYSRLQPRAEAPYERIYAFEALARIATGLTPEELRQVAADTQAAVKRSLAGHVGQDVLNRIDALQIATVAGDYARVGGPEASADLVEYCGPYGSNPNAFHDSKHNVLVICPGLLLAFGAHTPRKDLALLSLYLVLSHELGHAAATQASFAPLGARAEACLLKEAAQDFASLQEGRIGSVLQETVADLGAADVLGTTFLERRLSPSDALEVLRWTFFPICLAQDSDSRHGSTQVRIGFVLGRNPSLRKLFGCSPPASPLPSCALGEQPPASPR